MKEGDVYIIERHNDEGKVIEKVTACYRYSKRHGYFILSEFCKDSGMLDFFGARSWTVDYWRNKVTLLHSCPVLTDQYGNDIVFGDTVSNVNNLVKVYGKVNVALDENKEPFLIAKYFNGHVPKFIDLHEGVNTLILY